MDNQFNKQDFEKLLRENANQYRMYPSEKVWTGVHAALHTGRKWYRISALSMLLLSVTAISLLVLNYTTDKAVMSELEKSSQIVTTALPSQKLFIEKDNSQLIQPEKTFNLKQQFAKQTLVLNTENKSVSTKAVPVEKSNDPKEILHVESANNSEAAELIVQNEPEKLNSEITVHEISSTEKITDNIVAEDDSKKNNADSKINDEINALNSLNAPIIVKPKRTGLTAQVYITPTISYRKLSENKIANSANFSNYPFLDLNNIVNHKPATGFEVGIEGKYQINKKVSIKTGLQFNLNRYDIRAYSAPTEIATVAVNRRYSTDYVSTLSNYRNFSGINNPNWLENLYFQAAIPIGVELTLTERKNFSWGIAGTLQPTYVINDKAYLISSDYKNYAEFPDLMRHWNISSGFETFISYSTGRIKWQTGPHVRYQHLSSYVSGYPVKENLFAVGLKVAATFNKK